MEKHIDSYMYLAYPYTCISLKYLSRVPLTVSGALAIGVQVL